MKRTEEIKEYRAREVKTLIADLAESNRKLAKLKFDAKLRKLKNFHEITFERKKIARLWTILAEKAIENIQTKEEKNVDK